MCMCVCACVHVCVCVCVCVCLCACVRIDGKECKIRSLSHTHTLSLLSFEQSVWLCYMSVRVCVRLCGLLTMVGSCKESADSRTTDGKRMCVSMCMCVYVCERVLLVCVVCMRVCACMAFLSARVAQHLMSDRVRLTVLTLSEQCYSEKASLMSAFISSPSSPLFVYVCARYSCV